MAAELPIAQREGKREKGGVTTILEWQVEGRDYDYDYDYDYD